MRLIILPLSVAAFVFTPVFAHAGTAGNNKVTVSDTVSDPRDIASVAPLTLEQAWQFAERANAMLQQAQAQRAAAEGDATDARGLLWNNPRLYGERVRRDVPQPGMATENRREGTDLRIAE